MLPPATTVGYGLKADIWSMGVILWELAVPNPLANRFVGMPSVRYCRELERGERLAFPPETDGEYAALARACWAWKPSDRPDAAAIVEALAGIIAGGASASAGAGAGKA